MGLAFLLVVFTGIFIAPLVLGSYIIAEDADSATINGWFGFATLVFLAMAVVGAVFLFTQKLPLIG